MNDMEVITAAIKELGIKNDVKHFFSAEEAYSYLVTTTDHAFVILCDIRMPDTNGLTFRKSIIENEYLKKKSIPFVFFTGAVSQNIINEAYMMDVQGFYRKATNYQELKAQLSAIYIYWRGCLHPNSSAAATL